MTDLVATANVNTTRASRYLQQLAKHWSHRFTVSFDPQRADIDFGNGERVTLQATEAELGVLVNATSPEQLEGLKGAVASHLDRFAFREAPLAFNWR